MEDYLLKILRDETSIDPIVEILSIIQEKCNYGRDFNVLASIEKVIYLIGVIELEVNNGGFSQYLFNSSGKHAKEGIVALTEIGAQYTASLLEEAIKIYSNGPTNDGRNEPEEDDLTGDQEDQLSELDTKFYKYNDNLRELQIQYIKKHFSK